MSKSNDFEPGANELLNGTCFQVPSAFENPSFFATAYATALSYPWPLRGSLPCQGLCGVPPYHGGKAGLSVPTVSFPAVTRLRSPLAQLLEPVEAVFFVVPHPAASPARANASATSPSIFVMPQPR